MSRDIKKLGWKEFLAQYDASIHTAIVDNRRKEGVNGVATLRCEVLDSSRCGQLTALIYGPSCTYKSVQDIVDASGQTGLYVSGLPSSASFVTDYTEDLPQ